MLRSELTICEEQLAQSRLLMAQVQKDVYSQARREKDLRRQLERHDDDLVRARAATEDAKAQASMQTRVAEELKQLPLEHFATERLHGKGQGRRRIYRRATARASFFDHSARGRGVRRGSARSGEI